MSELQVGGALLVLAAFGLVQLRRLHPRSRVYLVFNVAGAGVLAIVAAAEHQWGFLLLESVWAAVAGWGLVRLGSRSSS
jgi:hypothetical protein